MIRTALVVVSLVLAACTGSMDTAPADVVENHCDTVAPNPSEPNYRLDEHGFKLAGNRERLQRFAMYDLDPEEEMPSSVSSKSSSASRDKVYMHGTVDGPYWNPYRYAFHFALWGWLVPFIALAMIFKWKAADQWPRWLEASLVVLWLAAIGITGYLSGSRVYITNQTNKTMVVTIDGGNPITIESGHIQVARLPVGASTFEVHDGDGKLVEKVATTPDAGPSYRRIVLGSPKFAYAICGEGIAFASTTHFGR